MHTPANASIDIRPFTVHVSDDVLDDLHLRLSRARWPDDVTVNDWTLGVPLLYMQGLIAYWRTIFNWRAQERYINSFANYRATVNGLGVHFIHERGRGPRPLPLLLTHGYPSSFYEMLKLVPLLTDPANYGGNAEDAFDVVIPSVPGHGFSDRPTQRGLADRQVAALWLQLMEGLGYSRFATHAYDLGASITGLLCLDFPTHVIGYHTTSPASPGPFLDPETTDLTEAEQRYRAYKKTWGAKEAGYAHLAATRPQTISYALNDSPAGLAAWIIEKWYLWTAPPTGNLDLHFSKDDLLTNVMIYWVTETINSANRFYAENVQWPGPEDRVNVPTGVTLVATQPNERPPREYHERFYPDTRRWEEFGRGGHFIALEEPHLVAEAIQTFFRELR